MQNVSRLVYDSERNTQSLINMTHRRFVKRLDVGDIVRLLSENIVDIKSDDENDVVLRTFFTNWKTAFYYSRFRINPGLTLAVFPDMGRVKYELKPEMKIIYENDYVTVGRRNILLGYQENGYGTREIRMRSFLLYRVNPFEVETSIKNMKIEERALKIIIGDN